MAGFFRYLAGETRRRSSDGVTKQHHHETQEKGRLEVLADYHLRVGQLTRDTKIPAGCELREQRLDETEAGAGTVAVLIDGRCPCEWVKAAGPAGVAKWLGLDTSAEGLVDWDVFEAVLTPGDIILLISLKDQKAAEVFEEGGSLPEEARFRRVRVVRDHGMFDRREAPQYYPEIKRPNS